MPHWNFPLINPIKEFDIQHYLDHIKEEIDEFEKEKDPEKKRKEAVDVLHAAETFVRKFFIADPSISFDEVCNQVKHKNQMRGYYDE